MGALSQAIPLNAVEALAIDTETTGLDARTARIVQIAAVKVSGGSVGGAVLDTLVDPGLPIPAETTAVHGITDNAVRGAPAFAAMAPDLAQLLAGRLIVGHTIAYDMAVLKREHELAALAWTPPRVLDVRPLARLVAPGLASHSLDRVAEWLGVEINGRHSAVGDARATAEVFVRLVPLLREKGIRTLAEATAAAGRLAEQDARASRGLMTVEGRDGETDERPVAIDSYAYRHRASDVMSAPPHFVDGALPLGDALKLLLALGSSSLFVRMASGVLGIATERDVLRAVSMTGAAALTEPVEHIARSPVLGVDEDDFVYRAIGRMHRLGIRHLAVRNAAGEVTGALTPRNLLRDRAMSAIVIGDAISAAATSADLAAAWGQAPGMAASLRREGVEARAIAAILSSEIQAITRRAAELAEAEMVRAGLGAAPVRYAVMVLGSAGRGESLLAADQDNAIVYAAGAEDGPEDRWLEGMAGHMNRILDDAGILYCKGGVMARNRLWRHSLDSWTAQVETWIRRQRPDDLLNVDIFFDGVMVAGDRVLADGLLGHARERARAAPAFLKLLTELARQWRSPLGLLGGFQKVDGRVDLKKGGLMPIFTGARVMALSSGIAARSSQERLEAAKALGKGSASDYDAVIDAHEVLLGAILDQQIEDAARGVPLSPRVAVDRLAPKARRRLKAAVQAVDTAVALVGEGRL
ncbi:MAG: DUF294 nucleotidyltransferase-like domain-containing protein [Hyphomicrobiaceae bacterium]|nr:DUF294 nucleotidyltransferase-like domain-containing protein [Hyphomicrobiaceae bacterium]